jgi:hypothetical protein
MLLVFACLVSLAVVYGRRERGTSNAPRAGAWLGLRSDGVGVLVTAPLFALGAFGVGAATLLVTVGGSMGFDALPAALLTAGIFGGILVMIFVWRRGSMIPALFKVRCLSDAPVMWATRMTLP